MFQIELSFIHQDATVKANGFNYRYTPSIGGVQPSGKRYWTSHSTPTSPQNQQRSPAALIQVTSQIRQPLVKLWSTRPVVSSIPVTVCGAFLLKGNIAPFLSFPSGLPKVLSGNGSKKRVLGWTLRWGFLGKCYVVHGMSWCRTRKNDPRRSR